MANETYSLVLSYIGESQFSQNILHYQFDDSGFNTTEEAALALCNAWDTANRTALKSILPIQTTLKSIKSRRVSLPGGFEAFLPIASGGAGTRTGVVCVSGIGPGVILYPAAQVAARGRVFLPGISDTDVIDGDFSSGFLTAFAAAAHIFSDPLTLTGGGGPVATPGILKRTPPEAMNLIGHVDLIPYPVTQRRRQRPV